MICSKHNVPFEVHYNRRTGGTFLAHSAGGKLCYPPKKPKQGFRCVECGNRRREETIPSNGVCRYCQAQKRKPQNLPIELSDALVVTTVVHKRLIKEAEAETPKKSILKISDTINKYVFIPFLISVLPLAFLWFNKAYLIFLFPLVWCLVLPLSISLILRLVTHEPRKRRQLLIDQKVHEIAEKRRIDIEERLIFYGSAEWLALRKKVIAEQGRVCAVCKKYIRDDIDITVDHIKPRSKNPHLALRKENLRVLCRQCNSSKGAKDSY